MSEKIEKIVLGAAVYFNVVTKFFATHFFLEP